MEIEETELPSFIDGAVYNSDTQFSEDASGDRNEIKLMMAFESFGVKMMWSFNCVEETQEDIYCEITSNIIQSLAYLLHEREMLLKIVLDDDDGKKRTKFDRNKFKDSVLEDFNKMTKDTQYENIYTEYYQNILNHFGRQFKDAPPCQQDEQNVTTSDVNRDIQNSPKVKSEEEEEMKRRMELKRKLERDATKIKKKKVLKF